MLQCIKSIWRSHQLLAGLAVVLAALSFSAAAANSGWWVAAAHDSGHLQASAYIKSLGVHEVKPSKLNRAYFEKLVVMADRGDVTAQYIVAIAYINGHGVSRNKMAGKRWLTRASESGNARAKALIASGIPRHHVFPDNPELASTSSPRAALPSVATVSPELLAPPTESELSQQREEHEIVKNKTAGAPPAQVAPAARSTTEAVQQRAGWQGWLDVVLAVLTKPYDGMYWTWWAGAMGLAFLTVGFWVVTGNTLGVSSSWDRLVSYRESRKAQQASEVLAQASDDDVERAMMEATLAEFGDDLPDEMREQMAQMEALSPTLSPADRGSREQRAPFGAHVLFLLFMTLGGTIAALTAGDLKIQYDMGEKFVSFFGSGTVSWIVLLIGGFLVGFGTRMGGGCTSGHGLSGCSRFQTGSLVGTAAFFGTAIVVSILLAVMMG
ncbi:MAG: YeeE/YedE family protein [Proteobacteria bacterium]|nr:YeeE/YedE family protein [Pseudomonadota bacterium]